MCIIPRWWWNHPITTTCFGFGSWARFCHVVVCLVEILNDWLDRLTSPSCARECWTSAIIQSDFLNDKTLDGEANICPLLPWLIDSYLLVVRCGVTDNIGPMTKRGIVCRRSQHNVHRHPSHLCERPPPVITQATCVSIVNVSHCQSDL